MCLAGETHQEPGKNNEGRTLIFLPMANQFLGLNALDPGGKGREPHFKLFTDGQSFALVYRVSRPVKDLAKVPHVFLPANVVSPRLNAFGAAGHVDYRTPYF